MEHHSNDLPWRKKFRVVYAAVDEAGRLNMDDLEQKLRHYRGRVRLVAITGASNVTGHVNPVHEAARLAHRYGAEIMVDGAQMVPHMPVNMQALPQDQSLDYLAFSGHKMYAPFGSGVLIGPHQIFASGYSEMVGGGTVETVTHRCVRWAPPPRRDEAGTPNVIGVISLAQAIETLTQLDMRCVMKEEQKLAAYARGKLSSVPRIRFYGDPQNHQHKIGIVSFNLTGLPHDVVAAYLAREHGIAVRSGCFCAQPYVQKLLGVSPARVEREMAGGDPPWRGMVRVSLGVYNTMTEVDALTEALIEIALQGGG
jgi:selenocysteine lyase/cysteine desulfurase